MLNKDELAYIRGKGRITVMGSDYVMIRTPNNGSLRLGFDEVRAALQVEEAPDPVQVEEAPKEVPVIKPDIPEVTLNVTNVEVGKDIKLEDPVHAKLAPSSMKMFKNCYASLLTPTIPIPELASPYAQEGTNAHELFASGAAIMLKHGLEAALAELPNIPVDKDEEMLEHITSLLVHCDKLIKAIGKDCILSILIEKKVNFSKHIYGTIDFGILYVKDNKKKIYALDLKYGKGVAVPAKDNEQLLTYVLSIIESENWDATEAVLAIYQPRNREHSEEPLDTYTIDGAYIKKARANLKRFETMALKVLNGTKKPKEKVGEWCMFCKRKAVCKQYAKDAAVPGLIALDKAPPLKKASELTDEQLNLVLKNADKIKSFIKAVEEYVAGRCATGKPLPGWKLIAGRSVRKWLENTSEVAVYLMKQGIENPYKNVLIGIGEAEKQLGKNKALLEPVTIKAVPKAKLVEESDPRPALTNVDETLKMLSIIEGD